MEQFKNLGTTTLNGGINNSVTSITVTDGSVFPSSGNFRIKIDNEFLLVTARSSNTLTVTRGIESSSAASHSDGVDVEHTFTAQALIDAVEELHQFGAYDSRPTTVRRGTKYTDTTNGYTWVYNGSSWDLIYPLFVPAARLVNLTGWTAANQSTETWTNVNGVLHVDTLPNGENWRGYTKPILTAPFTINAIFQMFNFDINYTSVGLGFRNSSDGKIKMCGYLTANSNFNVFNFNSFSSYNSNAFSNVVVQPHQFVYIKVEDDNTNWKFSISLDNINWFTQTETRNGFLTPDQIFIGFNNNQSTLSGINGRVYAYWE